MTTGLTSGQVIASYTVPANEAVGVETCDTPNHCTGKVAYRQAVLNAPQGETFPAGLGNRLAQKRALMRWQTVVKEEPIQDWAQVRWTAARPALCAVLQRSQ